MTTGRPLARVVARATAIQAALAALAVLLAGALFLAYRSEVRNSDRAGTALQALERLRGDVLSAQTSARGYALTGRKDFLEHYRAAQPEIRRGFQRILPSLTPAERPWVSRASGEYGRWRSDFARPTIALVAGGRRAAAARLVRTGRDKRRIDAFRRQIATVSDAVSRRVDDDQHSRDLVTTLGLIAIALVGLATVAATARLWRHLRHDVVEPMEGLADTAARFGEQGDLAVRADRGGGREAALAIDSFNAMAGRIDTMVEELRELAEVKTALVGSVSHELRTPLTSIAGYVDELREGELGTLTPEQEVALTVVARNADLLGALIDDLLLLGRLDADRLDLDDQRLRVGDLLAEICTELQPLARAKQVDLRLEQPDGGGAVCGDPQRLRQSFGNLVSNAVKFSPERDAVDLRVQCIDEQVIVEVEDHGPGIPADELPRIAERFFRASSARDVPGTGLGLSITRELVERHGGRLEVRSVLGSGSVFRVSLPQAA